MKKNYMLIYARQKYEGKSNPTSIPRSAPHGKSVINPLSANPTKKLNTLKTIRRQQADKLFEYV